MPFLPPTILPLALWPPPTGSMSPEEFERLKNEEKEHLRKLRALKNQHREVQRKTSILGALRGMRNPDLEADTDSRTEDLFRDAATQEARLDLALESDAASQQAAQDEADLEQIRKAKAEEMIRQMKAGMGEPPSTLDAPQAANRTPGAPAPSGPKTIGRTPPAPDAPPDAPSRDAKTIGRSSQR